MDDQAVEDDGYSDDDLDALPVNAFNELQEDAVRFTQQPAAKPRPIVPTTERSIPANITGGFGRLSVGPDVAAYHKGPQEPSSDYGDFDDEMLDGEIFDGANQSTTYERARSAVPMGESTQREQWRQQRYGAPLTNPNYQVQQQPVPSQLSANHPARSILPNAGKAVPPVPLEPPTSPVSTDVASLQAQVAKLLHEREALQQAVRNANDNAFAKTGEIAIVRAKISKAEQDFESLTKAQQRLHADEAAKYKAEAEKARTEVQKISSEKAFLENDLAEGTKQLRKAQKTIKPGVDKSSDRKGQNRGDILTTPGKSRNLPYGDGFDDNEVQVISPPKLALRGKPGTPKAGAKRKRKATEDSPGQLQPLEIAEPVQSNSLEELVHADSSRKPVVSNQSQRSFDSAFQFTQRLLNHRLERGHERTIEALSKFAFPSRPEKALSTILYDQVLMLGGGPEVSNVPAAAGLIVIALWSQCLKEGYHSPVHLLIDLVEYIILLTPLTTAPELTNSLMELVQETADIIIIPRCQKKPPRPDSAQITSIACLRVMRMMVQDCFMDTEEITRFWRTVRFDFIMMLLSFIHPLEEIHMTIALLRTSVLEKSFAMIIPPGDGKQDATEARIIDNLSRLLVESPRPTQGEPSLDAVELSELRLDILGLLDLACKRTHSAEALARHRLVIGRLVRVVNDELDRAYDYRYGHEHSIGLVNAATRLLYFLTTNYASLIDMQGRLSVIPGGEKKFLIGLTRLAFSEGVFLEAGIEDDVVDMAHQMLEMRVSPEEADQLVAAFASAQSTRRGSKEPA